MPHPIYLIVIALFLIMVIYNYLFSKKARINRKLKKAPWKKIAGFRNGEIAKIVGDIFPVEEPLIAPLTHRECSYYFVLVEQKKSSGKSSHWKTIIEKEVSDKFLIKDGEHYALINDHRIMSNIVIDRKFTSGLFDDATERLKAYLKKHGHDDEGFLGFNKEIRYNEGILENGERVAVLGKGHWESAETHNLPAEYGQILVITAADKEHIYLSDEPETTKVNLVKTERSRYTKTYRK